MGILTELSGALCASSFNLIDAQGAREILEKMKPIVFSFAFLDFLGLFVIYGIITFLFHFFPSDV